ncbi:hypothetical protein, partial [Marichromatium gracile]|uniref:hypothetical protein n=1 Tax=Marichromatium gracile TaxID=1048 RepID=UPI001913474A
MTGAVVVYAPPAPGQLVTLFAGYEPPALDDRVWLCADGDVVRATLRAVVPASARPRLEMVARGARDRSWLRVLLPASAPSLRLRARERSIPIRVTATLPPPAPSLGLAARVATVQRARLASVLPSPAGSFGLGGRATLARDLALPAATGPSAEAPAR